MIGRQFMQRIKYILSGLVYLFDHFISFLHFLGINGLYAIANLTMDKMEYPNDLFKEIVNIQEKMYCCDVFRSGTKADNRVAVIQSGSCREPFSESDIKSMVAFSIPNLAPQDGEPVFFQLTDTLW